MALIQKTHSCKKKTILCVIYERTNVIEPLLFNKKIVTLDESLAQWLACLSDKHNDEKNK